MMSVAAVRAPDMSGMRETERDIRYLFGSEKYLQKYDRYRA